MPSTPHFLEQVKSFSRYRCKPRNLSAAGRTLGGDNAPAACVSVAASAVETGPRKKRKRAEADAAHLPVSSSAGAEAEESKDGLELLREMFPGISHSRLRAALASSQGVVATAVAMLMSESEPLNVDEDDPASLKTKQIRTAISALQGETKEGAVFQAAAGVLLRIIRNVLRHPEEPKFRKIPVKSKTFALNVAVYSSSREVLEVIGFEYRRVDNEECVVHTGSDAARLYLGILELEAASNATPSNALQNISENTETIIL